MKVGGTRCGASVTAYSLFFKNLVLRNSPEMKRHSFFFLLFSSIFFFSFFFLFFFFLRQLFSPISSFFSSSFSHSFGEYGCCQFKYGFPHPIFPPTILAIQFFLLTKKNFFWTFFCTYIAFVPLVILNWYVEYTFLKWISNWIITLDMKTMVANVIHSWIFERYVNNALKYERLEWSTRLEFCFEKIY